MTALYQLPAAFKAIEDEIEMLAVHDGELNDATWEALDAIGRRRDELEMTTEQRFDYYCRLVRNAEAEAKMCDDECRAFGERAGLAWKRAARAKAYMKYVLEKLGERKIKTALYSTWIQNNPPSVKIDDSVSISELPPEYQRVTIEPSKTALMEAFRDGKELPPGVSVVQTSSLRIS